MSLRYYQSEAYAGAIHELKDNRSTMAVMATGLGKTRLFTFLAKNWPGRVLVLAHRSELVDQAADELRTHCREPVEIEMGPMRSERARIVVASVQSITQARRLFRIGKDAFSLIIVDEVHHYLAKTFRKVLDFFANAKVFGVTATADRTDKKAMGAIMDSVCYRMDIKDGVNSGYLVPFKIGRVSIKSIDLRGVKKARGDLHEGGLEEVMLRNVGAIVSETMKLYPDRQGIMFFPGVESAELAAMTFNKYKPGSAIFISGKTDKTERRELVAAYKRGEYQWLCNCEIATEGFDAPGVSLVGMCRPTLSRSMYTQMAGRGGRPDAQCLEGIDGKENSDGRRAAIAWSDKPDCIILDFVGNSGKHSLISPLDLLGGDYNDEERAIAKAEMEKLEDDEVADPEELLARARKKLEARTRALREVEFVVNSVVDYVDPFDCLAINPKKLEELELKMGRMPITADTAHVLRNFGVHPQEVQKMRQAQGLQMMRTLFHRKKYGLCTYTQLQILKKWGVKTTKVYKPQASAAIKYLGECAFGRNQPVDTARVRALATEKL